MSDETVAPPASEPAPTLTDIPAAALLEDGADTPSPLSEEEPLAAPVVIPPKPFCIHVWDEETNYRYGRFDGEGALAEQAKTAKRLEKMRVEIERWDEGEVKLPKPKPAAKKKPAKKKPGKKPASKPGESSAPEAPSEPAAEPGE